jgi:tetratricopeptide (TPR) repeat protein
VKVFATAVLAALLLVPPAAFPAAAQTTEADVFVSQAVIELDDRRYEDAIRSLQRALQIEPEHLEALYYMGVAHLALKRPAEGVTFLERARTKAPGDSAIAFQLGLAYFALGRYDQAEPLLEEVFRSQPELEGLGYYVGFIRHRKKDYRGALRAFRASRSSDPEIQQLTRAYTGLTLAALGQPAQAVAEVEQALRLAPASRLTGPVERLRDAVVAERGRARRFSAELRVGVFYDDNVRVLPDGTATDPLAAAIREQAGKRPDSVGEIFGARAEYAWLRTPDWESSLGYSFFLSYYNDLPSFNVTDHLATATLIHKTALGTMPAQAGLQYAFNLIFLDDDEFVRRNTATGYTSLAESDRHLTQLLGRYQHKDYSDPLPVPPEESRDGENWMLGAQHFLRFAEDRHFVKVGYQLDYDDTEGSNYEYRGHRILAGAQATLPGYPIRLKYDFDLHLREYLFANTLLPSNDPGHRRRRDEELNHIVRVEIPMGWSFTLAAEWLYTQNASNLDVFEYTRNVVSLTLSWTY